jgi:hypothetical protein
MGVNTLLVMSMLLCAGKNPSPNPCCVSKAGESSAPKPPATRKAKAENAKVSAVHAPHPGQSYNPAYEDHVDAINMVGGKVCAARVPMVRKSDLLFWFWRSVLPAPFKMEV